MYQQIPFDLLHIYAVSFEDLIEKVFDLLFFSAGVGRTGTFIALDYLLEKAAVEGVVDIYGLTWQMRRDRVNMIQTVVSTNHIYNNTKHLFTVDHSLNKNDMFLTASGLLIQAVICM